MTRQALYVLHHTHWDREWYQPLAAMKVRLRDVVREVMSLIEKGAIGRFYFDGQTCVLDDVAPLLSRDEWDRLRAYIRDGVIEVGPWYVLADEFLCPAEALVKNLEIGRKITQDFGATAAMGYLPDTFGHVGSMPTLLHGFGIRHALIWRGADTPTCVADWVGPDGSAVRTYVLPTRDGYFQVALKNDGYEAHLDALLERCASHDENPLVLYTDGADHTICDERSMLRLRSWGERRDVDIVEVSMGEFCALLDACCPGTRLSGELRDSSKIFVLSGTWSTRSYLKVKNDEIASRLVFEMEALSALERDASHAGPLKLDLWKRFLVNQAHDSICGCSIDDVHRDMERRYAYLASGIDEFRASVLQRRYPYRYDCKNVENLRLVVFNPTPYRRRAQVETTVFLHKRTDLGSLCLVCEGRELALDLLLRSEREEFFHDSFAQPWYEDVVAYRLSFSLDFWGIESKVVELVPVRSVLCREKRLAFPAISNRHYRMVVTNDGVEVQDRESGVWYRDFYMIVCYPDAGDSYNFSICEGAPRFEGRVLAARAVERGSVKSLVVTFGVSLPESLDCDRAVAYDHMVDMKVTSTFSIQGDSEVVRIETEVDNRAQDFKMVASFAGADVTRHASDGPFEWVSRHGTSPRVSKVSAGEELIPGQHPTATQVVTGALQLIHVGLHEYAIERAAEADGAARCELTLMRCVGDLSRRDLSLRGGGAGPGFSVPDAQCAGVQRFEYGFVLGRFRHSHRAALEFRAPVISWQTCVSATPERICSLDGDVCHSLFSYDDNGYLLRLWNPGCAVARAFLRVAFEVDLAAADLSGDMGVSLGRGRDFELVLDPGAIATYRLIPR